MSGYSGVATYRRLFPAFIQEAGLYF